MNWGIVKLQRWRTVFFCTLLCAFAPIALRADISAEGADAAFVETLSTLGEATVSDPVVPAKAANPRALPNIPLRFRGPQGMFEAQLSAAPLMEMLERAARQEGFALSDIVVTVLHDGEAHTPEMEWLIGHLWNAGVAVKSIRRGQVRNTDRARRKVELIQEEKDMSRELLELYWNRHNDPEMAKLADRAGLTETQLQAYWNNFKANFTAFFGIHKGITWSMYADKKTGVRRPWRKQVLESALAVGVASWVSFIAYQSLAQQAVENPSVWIAGGAVATWATSVIWGYLKRASNAFHSQPKSYSSGRKGIETNPWFFCISNLKDSILTNLIIKGIVHQGDYTYDIFKNIIRNSVTGMFAKVVPDLFISKHQQSAGRGSDTESRGHSEGYTIALNTGVTLFMGTLKIADLLPSGSVWSDVASWLFWTLAVGGLSYELVYLNIYANRDPESWQDAKEIFAKKWEKTVLYLGYLLGLREQEQCKTSILVRGLKPRERHLLDKRREGIATPEERKELRALGFL